jgi:pimeloyl-[acyl-carrier protein] methyl ester esterase
MKTLALSGWAQPADAVANAIAPDAAIFDYSDYPSAEASFAGLQKFADAEQVIGWSLGGQLALRAMAAGILKPKSLVLIGVPYQFLQSPQVKTAMDPLTYTTFRNNYAADPARTSARFHALVAKGDQKFRSVMDQLDHHEAVADTSRWLPWFDVLGEVSLHDVDLSATPAALIIHGEADGIVPVAQAEMLANALPSAHLQRWEGAAHAPHLHDAARLREAIAALG